MNTGPKITKHMFALVSSHKRYSAKDLNHNHPKYPKFSYARPSHFTFPVASDRRVFSRLPIYRVGQEVQPVCRTALQNASIINCSSCPMLRQPHLRSVSKGSMYTAYRERQRNLRFFQRPTVRSFLATMSTREPKKRKAVHNYCIFCRMTREPHRISIWSRRTSPINCYLNAAFI